MRADILIGDSRELLREHGPFDLLIADPPYGDTSLEWDRECVGWIAAAAGIVKPNGSMWVFGSMRMFQNVGAQFRGHGWRYAQDIVWEKHNGSGFHADRFKRVHEHACQFYRKDATWASVYNDVQKTLDATKRTVQRKGRPPHTGNIGSKQYVSEDGGPRIMRSVIYMRSMHGSAIHPTEKPSALLEVLIRTSCPPDGLVGDMFAGSGSAALAARATGRNYVGCEIDAEMAKRAQDRFASTLPLVAA